MKTLTPKQALSSGATHPACCLAAVQFSAPAAAAAVEVVVVLSLLQVAVLLVTRPQPPIRRHQTARTGEHCDCWVGWTAACLLVASAGCLVWRQLQQVLPVFYSAL